MRADMTIRYIGDEDFSRRYLIQRRDGKFFTGRGWAVEIRESRLYDQLSKVRRAYHALPIATVMSRSSIKLHSDASIVAFLM